MYSSPDYEQMFWDVATQTPMALALLVTGLFLLAKRRMAPRPCTIAAVTFLGLFVTNVILHFFFEWLTEVSDRFARNPNHAGLFTSWDEVMLCWKLTNVFSMFVHAIGVGVLGWCVTMDRKAVGRDE